MKLSQSERDTLTGPTVVGVVVGVFFAVCTVAFNSEYKEQASYDWSTISKPLLSFFAGFLLTLVPFGLAPVISGRVRSDAGNKSR